MEEFRLSRVALILYKVIGSRRDECEQKRSEDFKGVRGLDLEEGKNRMRMVQVTMQALTHSSFHGKHL